MTIQPPPPPGQSASSKGTSFNPLNLFDYAHAAGTVPSRLRVGYYSKYAVEAASANLQRNRTAHQRKQVICDYNAQSEKLVKEMGQMKAKAKGKFARQLQMESMREQVEGTAY